jgi:hypothetical protein
VVERRYADQLELSSEGVKALEEINAELIAAPRRAGIQPS